MAKPKSKPQLSLESAPVMDRWGDIPEGHWCRRFFTEIRALFRDEDFAELYQQGGRYPVSPALLACVTVLQYLFRVSDREAVECTIMRRDWRIALGLTPRYQPFHPTVLVLFRRRLVAHGRSRQLFETVLEQARALGLLGQKRLRVDATSVLADVARLSRAERVREAIRVVVCDLWKQYPEVREVAEVRRLYEAYGEERWLGAGSRGDREDLVTLAHDGQTLGAACGERPVRKKEVLARLLAENFRFAEGAPPELIPEPEVPKDHIVTPHDPDAEAGRKGGQVVVGDKAHVVETAGEGVNVITDVLVTSPRTEDSTLTDEIVERARQRTPEADTVLADSGYASAHNSRQAATEGIDLVAPPRGDHSKAPVPASAFQIDCAQEVARCPEGHRNCSWHRRGRGILIRFPVEACAGCPRREACTPHRPARRLEISRDYDQLVRDRARAATPAFKNLYKARAAIEATISQLVHRCGLRRNRYRGAPFRNLHILFAATALNVWRLLQCPTA